jgi:hypothetical protein
MKTRKRPHSDDASEKATLRNTAQGQRFERFGNHEIELEKFPVQTAADVYRFIERSSILRDVFSSFWGQYRTDWPLLKQKKPATTKDTVWPAIRLCRRNGHF